MITNNDDVVWSSLPGSPTQERFWNGTLLNNYQDTGTQNITVTYPDLSVTKTDGVATYVPGSSVTYTIVFRNVGNLADGAAVITDAKPAEVTSWTWTCGDNTGGASGCSDAAAQFK